MLPMDMMTILIRWENIYKFAVWEDLKQLTS